MVVHATKSFRPLPERSPGSVRGRESSQGLLPTRSGIVGQDRSEPCGQLFEVVMQMVVAVATAVVAVAGLSFVC